MVLSILRHHLYLLVSKLFKEQESIHVWRNSLCMGSTYWKTDKAGVIDTICRGVDDETCVIRLVDKHLDGDNLWAVWDYTNKMTGESHRFIDVSMISRGSREGEWGYKSVEEAMGPKIYTCPLAFLDLVPEPPSTRSFSAGWRDNVRKYWAAQKENELRAMDL